MLHLNPDTGVVQARRTIHWRTAALLVFGTLLSLLGSRAYAQVIPLYTFSASTSPYQPLTGAGTFSPIDGGGTDDDGFSRPQSIPFPFRFGFNSYTSYVVNTNGWITFGAGATTPYQTPLAGAVDQMIGFFAKDLRSDGPASQYSSVTTGTAPNRIHKIEAKQFVQYNNTTAEGSAQLWLYESGKIEMRYGTFNDLWIPGSTNGVQVGLRGSSITDVRTLSGSWGAPVVGSNSADLLPNNGAADKPTSGQLFTFSVPAGDLTPPTVGTITVNPLGGTCQASAHTVTASPSDASGLSAVELVYTVNGGTPVTLQMVRSGSTYAATIPAQGSNNVAYFVRVTDNGNNHLVSTSPAASYRDASLTINAGADQTHYVGETATLTASSSLGGTVRITEFTFYSAGTGFGSLPAYIPTGTDDFVEITNMGTGQVDMSNYGFEVQGGSAARTYSFPVGTVLPGRSVLVLHIGDGNDDISNHYYNTGGFNDQLTSGNDQAFLLTSPSGQVVDAVVANAFTLLNPGSTADWSGPGASSPRNIAGAGLYGADVNGAANWSAADAVPQSIGTINNGLPTLNSSAVQWTGTGITGTVTVNPLVTPVYTTAGTYTYTASVTSGGCTATDQVRVTVLMPSAPGANFVADRTTINVNDFIHITDLATNRPTSWRYRITPTAGWQFIAGTTPTSQNPYVQFTIGGLYTIKQVVTNAAGRDSVTKSNYINVNIARYCQDPNVFPCTVGYIDAVSILGTSLRNRGTGCASGASGLGYTIYPAIDSTTATLRAGLTYSITVNPSAAGGIAAWMDYNNDGVYDVSEFIDIAPRPNVAGVPKTKQFTIPFASVPGQIGLRVRSRRNASPTPVDACQQFFDGETEDYTITLIPGCNLAVPTLANNGPICVGQTLNLTATNLTSGATLTWTGPNGFTSTSATPSIANVTTAANGTYTLTINKAGCTTSNTVSVIVNAVPGPPTLASNSPVCAGQALNLTATNLAPGATLSWTGPNGFVSTSATPSIANATAAAGGTYTLTLTRAGCTASNTMVVTVSAAPSAPAVTSAARCGTGALTLTASGAPTGGGYKWYTVATGGTAIAGATGASYTTPSLTATTTYYVATTNGSCESPRTPVTASISAAPAPTVTAGGPVAFCQGGSVVLTAAAGGTGAGYQFLLNGQPIPGATGTTYTATQAGLYTVAASVGTCTGTSTSGVTVSVTATPAAPTAPAASRCGTGTLTLTASGAPTGGTYRWYATNTSSTILASGASYTTPSQSGVVTYYVSAVTSGGCEGPRQAVTAVANSNPVPTVTAGGATTFCSGNSVTLTASGGTGTATYQWLRGGQPITGATGTTYSATQSGVYTVTANNGASCSATSTANVTVTVNPAASAAFTYASSTYCLSGTNPTPSLTGTAGGTFSATPTGLTLNATTGAISLAASQPGTYVVTYAVAGQCPASQTQTVTLTTAPAAAFTYPTTGSRCTGTTGTLTPTLNAGSSAGTFTATPAGLSINAANGVIDLAASQPGTYTVTNTIAASGACTAANATASLTLTAAPTAAITASGPTTFCQGGSVTLTATGGTSYVWSTGATTASITVTTAGSYSVTATNAASCSATSPVTTVQVNATQSAAFTYGAATYCLGGSDPMPNVTGAANGVFSATTGLSINATTGEINLASSTAGTYTVTYTVGIATPCPTSATQTVTLSAAPLASFSYPTSGPLCVGAAGTVMPSLVTGATAGTFSASPTGLTLNATTGEVNVGTSAAGTYTVTNTVASSGSCPASSATTTISIAAAPTASITHNGPISFCQGDSVILVVSGGTSYLWSTGATGASITVRQSGNYTVTVTNAAGCVATSAPLAVTVTPRASAAFNYGAASYCLSAASAPAATVTGTTGGAFSATPAGLSINATTGAINLTTSTAGTYTVTYAVTGTCGASATQTLTLTAPAVAAFSYGTAAGCAGSTGTLTPTLATGATAGTFSTAFSGLGLDPVTGAIDLSTSQPGTYDVVNSLPASGDCGAVTDTAQVTINALPVVAITALSANYCAGDGATTLSGTVDGTPVTTGFTIDGTAATQFNPATLTPGAHTVVLTASNGTCSGSASLTVTLTPTPATPTISMVMQNGVAVLTSSATTGNLWYLGGTPIPGAIGQSYSVTTGAQNGNYTVVATVNGCPSAASAPTAVVVIGLPETSKAAAVISVYPNPTTDGLVTVELPQGTTPTPLTVLDVTGRTVYTTVLPAGEEHASLDLHTLPTGVYLVRLQLAGGPVIKRLVRE